MRKLLLTFFIVGMLLAFTAGKASAVIMASSLVEGTIDLSTLSIITSGTVTYNDVDTTTHAYAENDTPTIDSPLDVTTSWIMPNNTNTASVVGVGSAGADPSFLPLISGGGIGSPSPFISPSFMYADTDATVEGVGFGSSDSWTRIIGGVDGGASGGSISISVDYSFSIDLFSTPTYDAGGFSFVTLGIEKGTGPSFFRVEDDDFLEAFAFDGSSTGGPILHSGTLTHTLAIGGGEFGGFNIDVYGEGFAGHESFEPEPVPEPATIALLGIGLAWLGGGYIRKRFKRKNKP